ncbi:MAG: hypothetical protein ACK5LJ_14315 [Paracoccus sp. (in: a-proteobacteria)]
MGRMTGVWVYLLVLALTLIWPLVPRLVAPIFLGGCALLLVPLIPASSGQPADTMPFTLAGIALLAGFAVYLGLMFRPHGAISNPVRITAGQVSATTAASGENWYSYGKTGEGARYAPFDQITPENVSQLEIAWTARTGFVAEQSRQLQDRTHRFMSMACFINALLAVRLLRSTG